MYEHDEHGRMVRSQAEPEWDDEQRGWMLALAQIDADMCPGCRQPLSESTAQDPWSRPLHQYKVDPPHRCQACTPLLAAQKDNHDPALLWSVSKTS